MPNPSNPYGADPKQAFSNAWRNLAPQQASMGGDYWSKISNFNPQQSVEQYGRAAGAQADTYLTQSLDRLRGQAVGAGRLDTGFYDTDQGDVIKSVQQDLNEKLAMQGTAAAGMQLQQYGQMGNYAQNQQQQYYDLLTGQLDRDTSERNAKMAAKAAKAAAWGQAIGGIGQGIASHI